MTVSVGDTIRDAVERLMTVPGLLVIGLFLAFRLGNTRIYANFLGALVEFAMERAGYPVARLEQELMERGYFFAVRILRDVTEAGLDTSFPVAVVLLALLPFIAEFLHVVGVRALAADDPNTVPVDEIVSGLGGAYVKSLIANFAALVLIVLGSLFFLIPGLALGVLFFFVRHRIVLAGDGVFEAISNSYALVKENALQMTALGVVFWMTWVVTMFVVGMIPLGDFGGTAVRASVTVVIVFGISLLTSAYLQATGSGPQYTPMTAAADDGVRA